MNRFHVELLDAFEEAGIPRKQDAVGDIRVLESVSQTNPASLRTREAQSVAVSCSNPWTVLADYARMQARPTSRLIETEATWSSSQELACRR